MEHQIPTMMATGGGAISNASTAGRQAFCGLTGYVTSKHAVTGVSKSAALHYAETGVRVNVLAPGPILTERLEQAGQAEFSKLRKGSEPTNRRALVRSIPGLACTGGGTGREKNRATHVDLG